MQPDLSKILEECEKEKVPKPTFDLSMGGVDTNFVPKIFEFNTTLSTDTTQKTTVKSTVKVMNLIEINSEINVPEIAETLVLSKSTIEKRIKRLKLEKILERFSTDKRGHYKIM